MKNLFMSLFIALTFYGCENSDKKNKDVEIIAFKGMKGESVYIKFINPQIGYSFNNQTIRNWSKVTEEQMNEPNFYPESKDISTIYKTIDGGENWKEIYKIDNYHFYSSAFNINSIIYIKIIKNKDVLKNKLVKFDIKTDKVNIHNFNFERMGEIWATNQGVFINSKNKGINRLYSFNNGFSIIDSIKESKIYKDKVVLLNDIPFVVTWDNEIYNLKEKKTINIEMYKIECIVKKSESNIVVACKEKSSIILIDYNVKTKSKRIIQEFNGYNIIQDLHSNNNVICGFIGNIKGMFTEYDLFYSLDKGGTWHILYLKEKCHVRPNDLADSVLYIVSGQNRIQKISFK
jgi:hypothetical protein